jgi:hypothetical protein
MKEETNVGGQSSMETGTAAEMDMVMDSGMGMDMNMGM